MSYLTISFCLFQVFKCCTIFYFILLLFNYIAPLIKTEWQACDEDVPENPRTN